MVVSLGGIGSGPMAPTRSSSNSNSSSTTNHGSDAASGLTWLAIYFCLNLTLTIYNKAIMSMVGFRFPWMLTALHTFCGVRLFFCLFYLLLSIVKYRAADLWTGQ